MIHRGRLIGCLVVLAMLTGGCDGMVSDGEIAWRSSIPLGIEQRTEDQGELLVYFHASCCAICKRLERDTLSDTEIVTLLENYIPVRIDVDRQPNTAAHYNIDSVPALVIMDGYGIATAEAAGYLSVGTLKEFLGPVENVEKVTRP